MTPALDAAQLRDWLARLDAAQAAFAADHPGESPAPQPVHTVYGGAHLFAPDTAARLGATARRALEQHAGDFAGFARALALTGCERLPGVPAERARFAERFAADAAAVRRAEPQVVLAHTLHARVLARLAAAPVEDYRIDFEDGYGPRPDAEEDGHAVAVGEALAEGLRAGSLPPAIGVRIKPLTPASGARAARTLDLVLGALLPRTGGALPPGFVVTCPKVARTEAMAAFADLADALERAHGLAAGALRCELMVELPQALLGPDGRVPLRALVDAARGRCRGAHLGAYDYTAALGVAAADQDLEHPAAALARGLMLVALAGSGVWLADGAVNRLPVGLHRAAPGGALTTAQADANREAVHAGWRAHYAAVRRALREGLVQGWDLHPAQLVSRHAAVVAHYLEGAPEAATRLAAFVAQSARATRAGSFVEDEATGRGLLNFFRRGLACGALVEADLAPTGLSADEVRAHDFARIVAARHGA